MLAALSILKGEIGLSDLLPDLTRLEQAVTHVEREHPGFPGKVDTVSVNPTLQVLPVSWKNLVPLLRSEREPRIPKPERGDEFIIVWRDPETSDSRIETATSEDLLALKIVVEGIDPKEAARVGNVSPGSIDVLINRAVRKGILLAPPSKIRRGADFPVGSGFGEEFLSSPVFTLQWHITQACDLHCKHCYDRSERSSMPMEKALRVLDGLYDFCKTKNVSGQVSFSGGNPFLYPSFTELYRAASERGFALAILGNPVTRERVEELLGIEKPVFFQVSLEGLREHNDMVRGPGHFDRTMAFLGLLRDLKVYSMVMLTLTRDNIGQVIPLAETLRDLTDLFTFNRLSMVGEGARLRLPTRDEYTAFLESYLEAAGRNPVIALKDNLINIMLRQRGLEAFGGCTGYGCGAAFNFLTLLPDGEAHACRKFPSRIGNVFETGIADVYDSEAAHRYRKGCGHCGTCSIRPVCGGCLASAFSHGLDIFKERDPFCFIDRNR